MKSKTLRWLPLILVLVIALGGCSLLDPLQAQGTTNLDTAELSGSLTVDGASTLTGAVSAGSTLGVTGASTFTGAATFDGNVAHPDATNGGTVQVCEGSHAHTDVEAAVTICVIPADANIIDFFYLVTTSWNDGTGATVDCGISGGTTDLYIDGVDVNGATAGDVIRMGSAATADFVGIADVGAADATIVCQVAETDNDAAAGAAELRIFYYVD